MSDCFYIISAINVFLHGNDL